MASSSLHLDPGPLPLLVCCHIDFSAFVVQASGAPGGTRVAASPASPGTQDVKRLAFSFDGKRLYILGDLMKTFTPELFVTSDFVSKDQSLPSLRVEEAVVGGRVSGFTIVP